MTPTTLTQSQISMLIINNTLHTDKTAFLDYYRERAREHLEDAIRIYGQKQFKKCASSINKALVGTRNSMESAIEQHAEANKWPNETLLATILQNTYCNYVVMLETRNEVWPYEYMAFSRRIGELWEPFCKLLFDYPSNDARYFIPPLFAEVQRTLKRDLVTYIETLDISADQRKELLHYYEKVWTLVMSGEIKLELDCHINLNEDKYNIDFKSGFGSNEKGNTNRLLLVATIYKNLDQNYNCMLVVRSEEDTNNHYFQTLKKSGVWNAYCGRDSYDVLTKLSGYNLGQWIEENVTWEEDLSTSFVSHLKKTDLLNYLKW